MSADDGSRGSFTVTASIVSERGGHTLHARLEQVVVHDRQCWDESASCPLTKRVTEVLNATVPV